MFSPPKKFFFSLLDIGYDPEECPDGSLLDVEIRGWSFNEESGILAAQAFTNDPEFRKNPYATFFWELERGIGNRFISPDFKTAKMYGFDESWGEELNNDVKDVISNYHFTQFPIYTDVSEYHDRMRRELEEI